MSLLPLKDYQSRALSALSDFLITCAAGSPPERAFDAVLADNNQAKRVYLSASRQGLPGSMPFVCLRLPTGGGKTLLGCHAVGIAQNKFTRGKIAMALWLVPSTTVLEQTLDALRDPQHAYAMALRSACGGPVSVKSVAEALQLSPADADGTTVVIVSTIQAFRTDKPEGRKVFDRNGDLDKHFKGMDATRAARLEKGPDGHPLPSLANLIRDRRPIVIVDEAHNARTDLSFSLLAKLDPACVIEFSATPSTGGEHPSNVLHRVSASELKAENMIKLPIVVKSKPLGSREALLAEAVFQREKLEELAADESGRTGEYLRPILLIQAERVDDCEGWRTRLVSEYGFKSDEVRIATNKVDDLNDADLSSPKCAVRAILTVDKLREGWDCPFAYVLCSLRETKSATAMEQIIGRVLRLPGAKRKINPELNRSYAFSVSPSILDVMDELVSALDKNGFTKEEAAQLVVTGESARSLTAQPQAFTVTADDDADDFRLAAVAAESEGRITYEPETKRVVIHAPVTDAESEKLTASFGNLATRARVADVVAEVRRTSEAFGDAASVRPVSPWERDVSFRAPRLVVRDGGDWLEFDECFLIERPWLLSERDATLPHEYDPRVRPHGGQAQVDVKDDGSSSAKEVNTDEPGADFVTALHERTRELGIRDWVSPAIMIGWLDRELHDSCMGKGISMGDSAVFLEKALRGLMTRLALTDADCELIWLDRHRLRDALKVLIQRHCKEELTKRYQSLLSDEALVSAPDSGAMDFVKTTYDAGWRYAGAYEFKKHYYGATPGELEQKGEEYDCAVYLDRHPKVKFWFRNLSKRRDSFKLPVPPTGWFYPDFVCKLTDGRTLVVEYKGAHLVEEIGTKQKEAVGAVWQSRSEGNGVFVMPKRRDFAAVDRAIEA